MLTRRALLCSLVLATLLACKRSGSDVEVEATDHRSKMRVPSSWSAQSDLNEKADLQLGNRLKQEYLIVLTEAKEDFASMDAERLLEHHVSKLESGVTSPLRVSLPTTTLGAYPARQMELHATVNNLNIIYLVTAVEGPKYFHGIIVGRRSRAGPKANHYSNAHYPRSKKPDRASAAGVCFRWRLPTARRSPPAA